MFVIAKTSSNNLQELVPGKSIFLRPTPWKEAWKAGFDYVRRTGRYCFLYLPHEFANPPLHIALNSEKKSPFLAMAKRSLASRSSHWPFGPGYFTGLSRSLTDFSIGFGRGNGIANRPGRSWSGGLRSLRRLWQS